MTIKEQPTINGIEKKIISIIKGIIFANTIEYMYIKESKIHITKNIINPTNCFKRDLGCSLATPRSL